MPISFRRTAALALALLAGCGPAPERRETGAELFERPFSRPVVDGAGRQVGTVSGAPGGQGVAITVAVRGLPPGQHGMHLHEAGLCDPPEFATTAPKPKATPCRC